MASQASEVANDFSPFVRVYKDGTVERLQGTEIVPPSIDPQTGVQSKDVVISPETGVSARLYKPKTTIPNTKLPLLVYFHGGAFIVQTAFSPTYQYFLNCLVAEANIIAVSVDYRRAPEHPLPVAYDDSWAALKWAVSHSNGGGQEEWLNHHVDFEHMFIAGDSAGANIAHNMTMRAGSDDLDSVKIGGLVLLHPYFWGKDPIGSEAADMGRKARVDELWRFACPSTSGSNDPLINPVIDPKLSSLGCRRVLLCVAEKDLLRDRGWDYYEKLGKSGWEGEAEMMESEGEKHVFHLDKPYCDKAMDVLKRVISFINQSNAPSIRAPEHPLPIAFDDSWAALKWVASHSTGRGHEPWLNDYVDFKRIFLGGDSAGANIAHNMVIRVGSEDTDVIKPVGIVLVHPFFWGKEPIGAEDADAQKKGLAENLWHFVWPSMSGLDDPLINPVMDPKLSSLGCSRVLVCVAEKDVLRDRGWCYYEELGKSGWGGVVEMVEVKGEDHVFHLFNPTCENAVVMLKRVASFMNQEKN
ncbi:hypothetical protein F0562_028655 [Nyssa sinensis]|uniref:Alpha/beta hydrolase fold-3 domain-containing protein n=1 Tax=Nyssa sinensis TaxID=561372 RepID=A0A5J5B324_9ASTE|nr:hypothetical protein F0562_028655 [Nyssa sinensis]